MTETFKSQNQLKDLSSSAKVMQFCADIFAVLGIIIFAYLYFDHWENNPWAALSDPMFVVSILIPFVPAACFAYAASKKRAKMRKLLDENKK